MTKIKYFSIFILPNIALASGMDGVQVVLNNFINYLTGGLAKAIATLALVGAGFGCFALGKVPKSYVAAIAMGVGIVFGARAIIDLLAQ